MGPKDRWSPWPGREGRGVRASSNDESDFECNFCGQLLSPIETAKKTNCKKKKSTGEVLTDLEVFGRVQEEAQLPGRGAGHTQLVASRLCVLQSRWTRCASRSDRA